MEGPKSSISISYDRYEGRRMEMVFFNKRNENKIYEKKLTSLSKLEVEQEDPRLMQDSM